MKEQMTYVAIDADNVGESVGSAVLSDDVGQLSKLSEAINTGVQIFSKWAEFNGGTVISSGSDEAVFQVPITSIEDLETLKEEYSAKTGFTVSIGIGEKVSDAAKALIYAKMNGKNQITDYSPEMEQAMQQAISGEYQEPVGESEEVPEHEAHLDEEEKALHDSTELESDEEEIAEEEMAEVGEEATSEPTGDFLPESEEDSALAEDIESAVEEDTIPEEEAVEDEAMDEMAESNSSMDEDIDLDGEPDVLEEHGELTPGDDLDQDGDVEHEEAMAEEEEYSDEGDYDDEYIDEESSELSDSIASEMGEEEMDGELPEEEIEMEEEAIDGELPEEEFPAEEGEEIPEEGFEEELPAEEGEEFPEEEMVEGDSTEELKTVIFESLQSFKENREYLEMVSQENPELYDSLIYTLQAMIEMARELGYGNMEEGLEEDYLGEGDEVMGEAVMDEGEAVEEEMEEEMNPEDFAADEEEGGEEEEFEEEAPEEEEFEKNENFVTLLRKTNAFVSKMRMMKEEKMSIQEMKEKVKKKLEQQKSTPAKKSKKKASKSKSAADINEKKKNKGKSGGGSNDGSFCAKSHQKMRTSGKDCRANEDKNSPLCSARKKFNCRGKNEEKGGIHKGEKLSNFLKKKDEKELEKSKLATKRTTRHVTKPHNPEGTQKGYKVKDLDNETGKAQWIDGSRGLARDAAGDPVAQEGQSPRSIRKPKASPAVKV